MPSTVPRSPSEHYAEALRMLSLAGNAATSDTSPELQRIRSQALAEAAVHATLALAPRRARRKPKDVVTADTPTGSPRHRWLTGQDDQ